MENLLGRNVFNKLTEKKEGMPVRLPCFILTKLGLPHAVRTSLASHAYHVFLASHDYRHSILCNAVTTYAIKKDSRDETLLNDPIARA